MNIPETLKLAKGKFVENKKFLNRLKRQNSRTLDTAFHAVHDEVFEEIDCLECANCCKTTSPIFYHHDIDRLAAAQNLRPGEFVERYLKVDEDGDYVLVSSPCPFLGADNRCSVYADRPKACREYPHTNRKKMSQVLDLALRNTLVCPAVAEMVARLKKAER